jgi:hypothetical protein
MLVIPNKARYIWTKFLFENKILVEKYIVREIKKAVAQKKSEADLFKFEDGGFHAKILKKNFVSRLEEAKELFVREEEYEYAGEVSKLINSIVINDIIKDSTPVEE